MACNLNPTSNFLYRYFKCSLPEDIIDTEITVYTLKGIHTFRKDCSTQMSKCSPWVMEVKPFPSLRKKMKDYIEECQAIGNPFTHRSYPSRPNPSPFAKVPKVIPVKRRHMVTNTRNKKQKLIKAEENKCWFTSRILSVKLTCPSQRSRECIPGFQIYQISCTGSNINCTHLSISHLCRASQHISNAYTTSSNHL